MHKVSLAATLMLNGGMTTHYTIVEITSARQEIKKSRFIATAGPVQDEAAAKNFIAIYSDQSANHNCWAWRIGQNYRFHDAGEPSGTAGKPILAAIDGQGLDGVVVMVNRWFGGILLGSGGLIRAYGGTAALCLRQAEKAQLIETLSGAITCLFSDLALMQARLDAFSGIEIQDQTFTDIGAVLKVAVPKTEADNLARLVADQTSGRATLKWDE